MSAPGRLALPVLLAVLAWTQTPGPVATLTGAAARISGVPVELDAAGRIAVPPGAAIELDGASAQLNLLRGGDIHLCGPARVGLDAGGAGALLVSLQQGALELRYASPVADSLLTPDYRLTTIVPPDQLATVSASVALQPDGTLCVMNRGSALSIEGLFDNQQQYIINGQTFAFPPNGAPRAVASCPCATPAPNPVPTPPPAASGAAGALFPSQPALVANGQAPPPASSLPAIPPPAAAPQHNFLVRFFRWLVGK